LERVSAHEKLRVKVAMNRTMTDRRAACCASVSGSVVSRQSLAAQPLRCRAPA
jgi:hypothetical protein